MEWIMENAGTLLVAAIVLLCVLLALRSVRRQHKNGTLGCSGSCGGCVLQGECHRPQNTGGHVDKDTDI